MFHSIENPEKYLGFNRNGKPINYSSRKLDKQCRKIFKRVTEDSSNGLSTSPAVDSEPTSLANNYNNINSSNHPHRHKSSTRTHQRTHSNRIETSKSRSTSPHSSSKRIKTQQHPVRHHHNEQPLRHYHTISNNNKNIDSNDNMSSTKQLGNEDLNAIYINNVNESKGKQTSPTHSRPIKKPTQSVSKLSKVEHNLDDDQQVSSSHNSLGRDENNNNDTSNCTYSTKDVEDETDDKSFGGRRIVKGRNTAQANKCNNNNNNRRNRKNNENGRHSRKPSQKSSSHKNQQASP